ncbi:MAG: YihY/virulence factor BrkB family protein [Desulfobulbaceae bacterium]
MQRKTSSMTAAANSSAGDSGMASRLQRWAFRPQAGEKNPLASVRSWLRVFFIMYHEFSAAAISLRASALTYTIVLSLVPLLAMSTAILKGLGGGDQLRVTAYRLIDQLEPESRQPSVIAPTTSTQDLLVPGDQADGQTPPELATVPPALLPAGPAEEASQGARAVTLDLRRAVDTIFNYVDRTNFAAIGAFGIVGLLLTVILVMSTIEDAMNAIWHTNQGRSLLHKVMDYLALLLLLPVSINVAIAGEAVLASPKIMAQIQTVIPSPWAVTTLLKLLPFFFVLFSLTVMYMFFPSVRVKTGAAFTGALFAGIFWFLGQKLYLVLQIGVARSNAIYGSFATVPLFLIWVQLGWTFILLGASLAYAVQHRNLYRLPNAPLSPQRQLQLAFDVLQVVYSNFALKKRTTPARLSAALKMEQPGDILDAAGSLVRGGFLLQTDERRPAFLPTAPAEALETREVIRQVLGNETIPTPGGTLAHTVIQAAAEAIPPAAFPVLARTSDSNTDSPDKEEDSEKTL